MLDRYLKSKKSIFIYSFILFSIGAFYVSFFPPDEPKYVDAALRMIESGNYIVPLFNCHLRFDKPILYYWEIVLFFKIFHVEHFIKSGYDLLGLIEFAARLPSIIAASLTAVYLFKLGEVLFEKRVGQLSVLGFISVGFFIYLSRSVYPDMSLILFELMGFYYFLKDRYTLGWFFTALAFLVKGPIGIVSVGFTYFLYLWIVERSSGLKEFFSLKNGLGFLVFLLVSLPWYAEIYHLYGMEFVNKFLIYHNIERFTGQAHQHPHSFFYYFPIAAVALYIWWPFIFDLIKTVDLKNRKVLFLLVWFSWVFLFFSISRNKLPHYIAFGFLPVALLFALNIERVYYTSTRMYAFLVFEVFLAFAISFYTYRLGLIAMVPSVFAGFLIVALTNVIKEPIQMIFYKTITLSVVAFILLLQFEGYRPEKFVWHQVKKSRRELIQYKKFNQSIVAYTRRCYREVKNPKMIENKKGVFLVYTKLRHLHELHVKFKVLGKFLDKGTKTVLVEVNNG